jgi:GH25 family lysozyme M1 (1,4-beta-N-acetylmuramidase)
MLYRIEKFISFNINANQKEFTVLNNPRSILYNGIDVSVHNGTVDFAKVKSAGYSFVMIREGYGNEKAYPNQLDTRFISNYNNAKKNGMMVGAYHYLYATTPEAAKDEATAFIKNLKGKQFEMPIALDIEDVCQTKLNKATIGKIIEAFMAVCNNQGYYCVLYSYESFLTNLVPEDVLKNCDIWCANINRSPNITCGMHQYSFKGRVNGINVNVDLNHAYEDYPKIIKKNHKNGF